MPAGYLRGSNKTRTSISTADWRPDLPRAGTQMVCGVLRASDAVLPRSGSRRCLRKCVRCLRRDTHQRPTFGSRRRHARNRRHADPPPCDRRARASANLPHGIRRDMAVRARRGRGTSPTRPAAHRALHAARSGSLRPVDRPVHVGQHRLGRLDGAAGVGVSLPPFWRRLRRRGSRGATTAARHVGWAVHSAMGLANRHTQLRRKCALWGPTWGLSATAPKTLTISKGLGVPYGIRTRAANVKGWCPRPLDERDAADVA